MLEVYITLKVTAKILGYVCKKADWVSYSKAWDERFSMLTYPFQFFFLKGKKKRGGFLNSNQTQKKEKVKDQNKIKYLILGKYNNM